MGEKCNSIASKNSSYNCSGKNIAVILNSITTVEPTVYYCLFGFWGSPPLILLVLEALLSSSTVLTCLCEAVLICALLYCYLHHWVLDGIEQSMGPLNDHTVFILIGNLECSVCWPVCVCLCACDMMSNAAFSMHNHNHQLWRSHFNINVYSLKK